METVRNIMVHAHSGLRWVVLLFVILAIIKGFGGMSGKKEFGAGDKKVALFGLIFSHLQLVIGLVLYFISDKVIFSNMMGSEVARFYGMEHISGMILGIALITIGYSTSKRATESKKKFKRIAIWYTIGLLVILATIPWPFMQKFANVGVGWF